MSPPKHQSASVFTALRPCRNNRYNSEHQRRLALAHVLVLVPNEGAPPPLGISSAYHQNHRANAGADADVDMDVALIQM